MSQSVQPPEMPDDPSVVEPAFQKAKTFFATGKSRDLKWRIHQLQNFLKGLKTMKKELSDARTKDLGCGTFENNIFEINTVERECQHTLNHIYKWAKADCVDTPMPVGPGKSYICKEPMGVIAVIGSWNYPYLTILAPLVSVIAAGNAAVVKPSEQSPYSSKKISFFFKRWLDKDAFQCVLGQVEVAKAVTSTLFDKIIFTGSTFTGRLVAQAAAKNLTPCCLELGGKSPCIIDRSSNYEYAAQKIALGAFCNSGQTCIRPDYVYVQSNDVNKFMKLLETTMFNYFGKHLTDRSSLGKVINEYHHNRCCQLLANHGGTLVIGNPNAHTDGNLTPTVILNPLHSRPIMQEEIFGPILPVLTYNKIEEVIEHINSMDKPLAVYYFGSHRATACQKLQKETSSGAFVVNDCLIQMLNSDLPFGGVGGSGYGRYHGQAGFKECSNLKSMLIKPQLRFWPFSKLIPPYSPDKQSFINLLLKHADYTQAQIIRRLILLIVFLWIIKLIVTKRLTIKKIKKVKAMIGMAWQMM